MCYIKTPCPFKELAELPLCPPLPSFSLWMCRKETKFLACYCYFLTHQLYVHLFNSFQYFLKHLPPDPSMSQGGPNIWLEYF